MEGVLVEEDKEEEDEVDNASHKSDQDDDQRDGSGEEQRVDSSDGTAKANDETVNGIDPLLTAVHIPENVEAEIVYTISEAELTGTSFLIFICRGLCFWCLICLFFRSHCGKGRVDCDGVRRSPPSTETREP